MMWYIYFDGPLLALGSVWIPFITENWKHYSEIIFKCVNNAMRPRFKVRFAKICTCGSHEQCTGPTEKHQTQALK